MNFGAWQAETQWGERNIFPVNDLRIHTPGLRCWCRPHMDGCLIVHNSMDQREHYEIGLRKVN